MKQTPFNLQALGTFEPSYTGNYADILPMFRSALDYLIAGHEWSKHYFKVSCEEGLQSSIATLRATKKVFEECLDMEACPIHVLKSDGFGNKFNLYPFMSFINDHGRSLLDKFMQVREMMRMVLHEGNILQYKSCAEYFDMLSLQICTIVPCH